MRLDPILTILAIECLVILWLFWKHLLGPRQMQRRLRSVDVEDISSTADFPKAIQAALSHRYNSRHKSWHLSRVEGSTESLDAMGEVFREEDFYVARKVNAAPGAMAGMGILGTFLGLALGLGNLDITTSDKLMSGIQVLLNGLSMAAWSSVLGIAGSLIFTAWSRRVTHAIQVECQRINREIEEMFPVLSPGQAVRQLLDTQEKILSSVQSIQTDFIMELADMLAEKMEEGQRKFQSNVASGLSDGMLQGVRGVLGEFSKTLEQVLGSVVPLAQQTKELVSMVNSVISKQQPAMEKMDEVIPKISEATEKLNGLVGSFGGLAEQIGNATLKSSETASSFERTSQGMKEALTGIVASVQTITQMKPALETLTDRFENSLDKLAVQTDRRLAETFTTFDQQLATVASKLVTVADEMSDAMDKLPAATQQLIAALNQTAPAVRDSNRDTVAYTPGQRR